MLCVMQNHMVQAFANSGNAIKPVSFIRDLKSKHGFWVFSVKYLPGASSVVAGRRKAMNEVSGILACGKSHTAMQVVGADTWAPCCY